MSNWPEGWTRGGDHPADAGDPDATQRIPGIPSNRPSDATRVLPPATERPPAAATNRPPRPGAMPPPGRFEPPGQPARTGRGRGGAGAGRWLRRVGIALLLVLALLIGLVFFFFSRIHKVDALHDYAGRPAVTPGEDWLLVGSDSREGLTAAQRKQLKTGSAAGRRTDTIILLHRASAGGHVTMVSLPRDSYVPIPGHGRNKLNAAYAFGGAPLLVQTVEAATGIRIDHYTEIGFGGFVGVVDAIGGVQLCPPKAIKDKKSGLNVQAGCQQMNGPTSLAYVRARYFDPKGDLGRVQRQQQFLSAIFARSSSPGVLLNPIRLINLGNAATTALTVDQNDGVVDLLRFGLAMRAVSGSGGTKTTVPVADPNYQTPAGSSVRWDRPAARRLFNSLR